MAIFHYDLLVQKECAPFICGKPLEEGNVGSYIPDIQSAMNGLFLDECGFLPGRHKWRPYRVGIVFGRRKWQNHRTVKGFVGCAFMRTRIIL
ncbi:MAG: hypothetical protein V4752_16710, partial [Pantoea dispersa]